MREPWYETKDGPMALVEVLGVYARVSIGMGPDWYEVRLRGGKLFCLTGYHAFVAIRDGQEVLLRGGEFRKGDRFWVDVSAFGADKSLTDDKRKMQMVGSYLANGFRKSLCSS